MKILLSGGGTVGSVSPLLAIKEEMLEQGIKVEFAWIGTESGVEVEVIKKEDIPYHPIVCGKLRRYFSFKNISDIFRTLKGVFQAMRVVKQFNPDLILSAGSYVSVPVLIAGRVKGKTCFVHQQDLVTGLANKLMKPWATKVTVAFEESMKDFSKEKVILTGNPIRKKVFMGNKAKGQSQFGLDSSLPTLLVMGGSLGAEKLNELVFSIVTKLVDFCQIIHITGKGQLIEWVDKEKYPNSSRYHATEYLYDDLIHTYAAADLVICRAGLSTLTELTALEKPSIVIPIPDNQQEKNAQYFDKKNAIVSLNQKTLTAEELFDVVKGLIDNPNSRQRLSFNIKSAMIADANKKYVDLILATVPHENN